MTLALDKRTYTAQEYLDLETQADTRHEYHDREIIEMTGGNPDRNRITVSLCAILHFGLKRQPYDVFVTDQRLWIPTVNRYTYPDIMVTRDPLQLQEGRTDTITNPLLIAEVLSKSTCNYDRADKFSAYRTISSFKEYLTIDQYAIHIEHYTQTSEGWLLRDYYDIEKTFTLTAIDLEITIADLYDKVDLNVTNPESIA
ncbi:Uma2 family endonuclease [Oscillatoriales cyanobacterium LEGE 11467]|uniref:Uma2 family endonuclease n=1 Tax=Zarconia navalis LEGE 11467 TaxID=1828826 RepID=A0A928Z8C3_9CYAN|nr:Uma2 family endonuclease [Zarconia navalis]MBE9042337.1 Uma2 family endonuclease [Zarconia navalis LEGE 11467]